MGSSDNDLRTIEGCVDLALQREETEPRGALDLYRQAEKLNTEVSAAIVIVALLGPPLAIGLSLLLESRVSGLGFIFGGVLVAYLGFGPAGLARIARDTSWGLRPRPTRRVSWVNALMAGPYYMLEQVLVCLTALFGALFALGPVVAALLLLDSLGRGPTEGLLVALEILVAVTVLYALLAVLADLWYGDLWPPLSGLRFLFAHLRANLASVCGYAAVLLTGHLFAFLALRPEGVFLDPRLEVMVTGVLSGVFLAIALSRGARSLRWKAQIKLGVCRCHVRLGNWGSARVPLRRMFVEDICAGFHHEAERSVCNLLTSQLMRLTEAIREGYRPRRLEEFVDKAEETLATDDRVRVRWERVIKANRLLIEDDSTARALERAARRSVPDLMGLFVGYWWVGIGCFVWWLVRMWRS